MLQLVRVETKSRAKGWKTESEHDAFFLRGKKSEHDAEISNVPAWSSELHELRTVKHPGEDGKGKGAHGHVV